MKSMSGTASPYTINKYWVWLVLCLPAIFILVRYKADAISYGATVHETGQWSVALLFAAMAVTPLRRLLSRAAWPWRLQYHRRAIGVASFGYAALHALVYLEHKWGAGLITAEGARPDLLTGWIALAIFLVLAVTSNNASVRMLGQRWKTLHRSIYVAAGLTFAHWALTAVDPMVAVLVLAALVLLEAARLRQF